MKLQFSKNNDGQIFVSIDEQPFAVTDYVKMVHEIKDKQVIEVEFADGISDDEKNSVNAMIKEINQIGKTTPFAKNAEESNTDLDF